MQVERAKIRISSNLLREPHAFDRLGNLEGGMARDILLWASWKNTQLVQLNVPDFCKLLGYDRRHVLRELTPDQVSYMIDKAGFLPKSLDRKEPGNVNSLIAYVITVMFTRTLTFAHRANTSTHQSFNNKVMVRDLHVFDKKKKGTIVEFSISEEVLEQSRDAYQTIDLTDYLSLCTKGGSPDDAARKMYWRLLWKRQYWDYLEREGKLKKGDKPSEDFYPELLKVAGMQNFVPAKNGAYRLRKLLDRVSALPSIKMEATMRLNPSTGSYEVTWKRGKLTDAGKPTEKPTPFPCEPAPAEWGTDPNPPTAVGRPRPVVGKTNRPSLVPAKAAAAQPAPALASGRKAKLMGQLEDAKKGVLLLLSPDYKASYDGRPPGTYEQHLAEAQATVARLEQEAMA
jgi:hypothetical protein